MLPTPHAGLVRRMAWACVLLMLVVTTASAWLRLAAPRPECLDWPGCRAAQRPAAGVEAATSVSVEAVTRGLHRVAASTVLVAVIALAVLAARRRPRTGLGGSIALLALALGLAVLGVVTPGSRSALVLIGNLWGGFLLLALSWRWLRRDQAVPALPTPLALAAWGGAGLWLTQAGLGALAGARMLDAAPMAHVALALAALPLAFGVGWQARKAGRVAEGRALMAIALVQGLLGASAAASAAAPLVVLSHNLGAATGIAILLGLTASKPNPGRTRDPTAP